MYRYNSIKDPRKSTDSYTISSDQRHSAKNAERAEVDRERQSRLLEQADQQRIRNNKYAQFISESKDFLLGEAIYKLVAETLTENTDPMLLNVGKNLSHNFVKEESTRTLLNRFKTQSVFLSEMASVVEEIHSKVLECAKENLNDDFTISNSDLEAFYNKLDQLDYSNMANAIRAKVSKAEEEFIQANINDRLNMEEIANKTKEKIDQVKMKDAEVEAAVKQEFAALYKESVSKIQDRKKSLLESFVLHTTQSILIDDGMRTQYTTEGGKLNTKAAIELAEVMYTFLEAVNTSQMKEITPSYLENVLAEI